MPLTSTRFIVPIRSVHRSVRNRVVQVLSAANGLAIIKGDVHLPCAVPCSRTKRCPEALICGHQCPSLCGEICPEGYCHVFSTKQDNRVDLLEMKSHNEIDLDESPIVVLGCGYFLTAETLDGMIGMAEVYDIDSTASLQVSRIPHRSFQIPSQSVQTAIVLSDNIPLNAITGSSAEL